MGPIASCDGHDGPGLTGELGPRRAAVIYEVVVGFEDAVGKPVVAHELPDVFDRVEFGRFWWKSDDGDVGRHEEARRSVPARLIDQEHGVGAGRDGLGDRHEVQVHRLDIAGGQDQGRALALFGTDSTEDVGGGGALVAGSARAGAALGPSTRDLVLLADARFVLEPNLYRVDIDRLLARDFVQA